MGDRTHVVLTVMSCHHDDVLKIFEKHSDNITKGQEFSYFSFDEVNYGNLPWLDTLIETGIAYDSEWGHGAEYSSGMEFCRFTADGELQRNSFDDSSKNPNLDTLIGLIDKPKELRKYILEYKDKIIPLPWDNQEEYGKLYRMRQLIAA